ncbi:hypothetical protein BHE90_005297 [Fusarium euwallaceae]|uniref:Xylanolytic transcriptional activator regulatory domain-containing protein n=1 Tax=Fusarium euwallaceae TaxID=1147111 RepID=A0A430LWZ3_9HYPO|nr:hypothetical protein BHE90_005297 [Fusarium euwallaceae]
MSRNIRSHVLLSICAWGANFYRDESGSLTLKDQGFMIEWAKKAGKLVFQEAEELDEDNLVTFFNLALFWHSQGSWRISYLHKGNACQLIHIIGLGSPKSRNAGVLGSEIRRRRLWACYLMHCFSSEKLFQFNTITDIQTLALPWPEGDFQEGVLKAPPCFLGPKESSQSIFAELVRGLTLWCDVVSAVKSPEVGLDRKIADIFVIENKLSVWWGTVQPDFKLDPRDMGGIEQKEFSTILLMNLVYYQSLCALHASIVPLFCWTKGDRNWPSARQLSAQTAFEHAGRVSELIGSVLPTCTRLSAMPSYVAYAAYCSCAIQIPFLWCSEPTIRERAHVNVGANVRMMQAMSPYWKLASLLELYARCIYDIHERSPPLITNEPKYADISEFTSFRVDASLARPSILEFTGVLRSSEGGYVRPGEESNTFGIESDDGGAGPSSTSFLATEPLTEAIAKNTEGPEVELGPSSDAANRRNLDFTKPKSPGLQQAARPNGLQNLAERQQLDAAAIEWPTLDLFNSLFDAEMANFFPDTMSIDPSLLDVEPLAWDFLDVPAGEGD